MRIPEVKMRSIALSIAHVALALLTILFTATRVAAETITPSEAYRQYRAALFDAKDVSSVSPLMTKSVNEQINATPEKDKSMMFDVLKHFSPKTVHIVSERIDGEKAVLTVSGDPKENEAGTVTLLRENGSWKMEKETWKSHLEIKDDSPPIPAQK